MDLKTSAPQRSNIRIEKPGILSPELTTLKISFTPSLLGENASGTNNVESQFFRYTESLPEHPRESVTVTWYVPALFAE